MRGGTTEISEKAIKRFEDMGVDFKVSDLANEVGVDKKRAEFLLSEANSLPGPTGRRRPVLALGALPRRRASGSPDDEAVNTEISACLKPSTRCSPSGIAMC